MKAVPEVAHVFCATNNPLQVVIAVSEVWRVPIVNRQLLMGHCTQAGRGIMGVIDGGSPLGVESDKDKDDRVKFLRMIGLKRA